MAFLFILGQALPAHLVGGRGARAVSLKTPIDFIIFLFILFIIVYLYIIVLYFFIIIYLYFIQYCPEGRDVSEITPQILGGILVYKFNTIPLWKKEWVLP